MCSAVDSSKFKLQQYLQLLFVFMVVCLINFLPSSEVLAAGGSTGNDGISEILCRVANVLTGAVGKAISIIAVCVLGIGLFMGKLSWALGLSTGIGIGLIFGAPKIVRWLADNNQHTIGECVESSKNILIPGYMGPQLHLFDSAISQFFMV